MTTIRVLHVITSLNVGGAERSLASVIHALRDGYAHAVVSLGELGRIGEQLRKDGVTVLPLRLGAHGSMLSAIPRVSKLMRTFRPTIFQGWMYHGNVAAWLASKLTRKNVPVLSNIRHSLYDLADEKPRTRWVIRMNRRLSAGLSAVIYNSVLSRTQHERFGFGGYSQVIANGFDVGRWMPDRNARQAVRQELGIGNGSKVVGHFARFHPIKDHETFIRASEVVLASLPEIHIVLAGAGVDAQNFRLLEQISAHHRRRVHLLGERSDIERLMSAIDVFCLSSRSEAFPNVLGEAMACGVPCVATDVGDCKEIIGATGIVVRPYDPGALASALIELLSKDDSAMASLRSAARDRVRVHFSLEAMAKRFHALYEHCLSGRVDK